MGINKPAGSLDDEVCHTVAEAEMCQEAQAGKGRGGGSGEEMRVEPLAEALIQTTDRALGSPAPQRLSGGC